MDEQTPEQPESSSESPGSSGPQPIGDSGQFTQQIRHQQVSARVPEHVAQGVFASGSLLLNGSHEFIIDFLQTVTRPHQVAARIVLPPTIVPGMLRALKQNLDNYAARFGPPPSLPKPPEGVKPPSVEEVYGQLKMSEQTACGVYANTVMITHSPSEFCFDFIASFYPRSTVTARIYMAAHQGPRLHETLSRSWEQYQQKFREAQQRQLEQQRRRPADEGGGPGPMPGPDTRWC